MTKRTSGRGTLVLLGILFVSACLSLPRAAALAQDATNLVIQNEYISIIVNAGDEDTGRFAVDTTYGDPARDTDDYKNLIYGSPTPWTSYTTVRIDGRDFVFGGPTKRTAGMNGLYGVPVVKPQIVGEGRSQEIVAAWEMDGVLVTQRLGFARSTTTGLYDTSRIAYVLENRGQEPKNVGLRLVIDTMLGSNDGAPFKVAGTDIYTDTEFSGSSVPEFWQAFDSLENPTVIAQGTLKGGELTPPDTVFFTSWGSVSQRLWDVKLEPGRDFTREGEFELDSAMVLRWDERPLQPGESRTYVVYYGLGGVTISPGKLLLGITSPAEVALAARSQVSFPVVAYVQNTGEGPAPDVTVKIALPKGFELADGASSVRKVGDLGPGQMAQVAWDVVPARKVPGTFRYFVSVQAYKGEPNVASRSVTILAPPAVKVDLSGPKALEVVDEKLSPDPFQVTAVLSNPGGSTAYWVEARLELPPGLALAGFEKPVRYIGALKPGEEYAVTWHVTTTGRSGDLKYAVKASSTNADPQDKAGEVKVPLLSPKAMVVPAGLSVPAVDAQGRPAYFSLDVVLSNVPDFAEMAMDIQVDPEVATIIGVSRGRLFVDDTGALLDWTPGQIDRSRGTVTGIEGRRGAAKTPGKVSGTVATLMLRSKAPGTLEVKITRLVLKDKDGRVIEVEVEPGRVIVR